MKSGIRRFVMPKNIYISRVFKKKHGFRTTKEKSIQYSFIIILKRDSYHNRGTRSRNTPKEIAILNSVQQIISSIDFLDLFVFF